MTLCTPMSRVASRAILEVSPYRRVARTMADVVRGGMAPGSGGREQSNDVGVRGAEAHRNDANLGEIGTEDPDPAGTGSAVARLHCVHQAIAAHRGIHAAQQRNPAPGSADQTTGAGVELHQSLLQRGYEEPLPA